MSLVVAAHNHRDIVIGSESLSVTDKTGQRKLDSGIEKVIELNNKLAFMITGTYASDKLHFISDYKVVAGSMPDMGTAFADLLGRTKRAMKLYPREGFMMGLAGYSNGAPGFKLITCEYGQDFGYVEDYPYNYYLSGQKEVVELAERRIKTVGIDDQTPTSTIDATLQDIITECVEHYPETLGLPVEMLTLGAT